MDVHSIACIGAGYVGGPTSAVIARHWPEIRVTVVDRDAARIEAWRRGPLPVHEAGLAELVSSVSAHAEGACGQSAGRNLVFSTDIDGAVRNADIVMVAVNTPSRGADGALDTAFLDAAVLRVARSLDAGSEAVASKVLVLKSTAPVGTAARLERMLSGMPRPPAIVVNPEFLAEGSAVRDLESPDRVVIGGSDARAVSAVANVYARWVPPTRILCMSASSAEVAKLAANAMLAQRLSAVHALGALCEHVPGADVRDVAAAVGADTRLGPHFLRTSPGWGGSCFRKDVLALSHASLGLPGCASFWRSVVDANAWQTARIASAVAADVLSTASGEALRVAVLGAAFKSGTGDCRDTAAAPLVRALLAHGLGVSVHDPLASASDFAAALQTCHFEPPRVPFQTPTTLTAETLKMDSRAVASLATADESAVLDDHSVKDVRGECPSNGAGADDGFKTLSVDGAKILFTRSVVQAVRNASALVVVTEHAEYARLDGRAVYAAMAAPAHAYDCRHVLDARALAAVGFRVRIVGVSPLT